LPSLGRLGSASCVCLKRVTLNSADKVDLGYVLVNAADAQEKLGRTVEAERIYRQALAVDAKNADAANGLGLLMAKQGRNEEARKLFESAIAARRDDADAINNLGVLYQHGPGERCHCRFSIRHPGSAGQ
jgi:Tfp pilus assembly protein PilF